MVVTWDPSHSVAYIRLREKRGDVETVAAGEEIRVDMAPYGTVYGFELLNANSESDHRGGVHVPLVNEASGERRQIAVPERG